ncbi:MAG TPA: hypothetical protein VI248_08805 [Kineosporiaceae bacterium]
MRLSFPTPRLQRPSLRRWAAPVIAATVILSGGTMIAKATTASGQAAAGRAMAATPMMMGDMGGTGGRGVNGFGMTLGNSRATGTRFTYTHGFFCDTTVPVLSATGCEVGAAANVNPPGVMGRTNTLFITVPLGFNVGMLHCPNKLTCIDHPGTVDMTRLAAALAPIFKTTPAQLTPMLRNFPTPGHDHFVMNRAGGRPQWWNVKVIGVTSPITYRQIRQRHSLAFVQQLLATKNPTVVGPIPTNIFLFFAAS